MRIRALDRSSGERRQAKLNDTIRPPSHTRQSGGL